MTDPRRPGPPRPPVRLRPAPSCEPPFADDDVAHWPAPAHVQLALDLSEPARRDPDRPPGRRARISPTPAGPGRRPADPLPPGALVSATAEATRAAHRFVCTCVEVLNGYRPPGQLRPLLDPARAAGLLPELARATARSGPVRRRSTRPTVRLRRLRVCEPRSAVVEAAAVLAGPAGHSWAMALRLEHRRGAWLCTALRVL
ncbi:Rv3235 family protein [Micromonospora sp. CPCC 205561]|uniref:Rv3235 family protein n=1 Tax=Micromonospora sp. CPCC 205561 TaxID=3122407 RepID=UPI002FF056A9